MSQTYMTAKINLTDGTIVYPQVSMDNITSSINDPTLVTLAKLTGGTVAISNLPVVTVVGSTSTDLAVPTAKAVYDYVDQHAGGGGGSVTGIASSVSGGTATVTVNGGTGAVKFVGSGAASVNQGQNGEIVISAEGGGGGGTGTVTGIEASVSGGTATIEATGSTTSVKFVGKDGVGITGSTNGEIEIGATVGSNLVLPSKCYAVVGREANIYYDNLYKCPSELFNTQIVVNEGDVQNERWTYTPSQTGNVWLSMRVRSLHDYTLLAYKGTTVYVAASSSGSDTNIKCSFIGDSNMATGWITGAIAEIASTDVMGVTLIGLYGSGDNRHEGHSGWTIAKFTSNDETYYKFTVSGVTTAPEFHAEYSYGGAVFAVKFAEISSGSGSITCSLVSGSAPTGTGTLTKTNSKTGDATIAFSAVDAVPANPFWFNGEVNYSAYLSAHSFATPDFVFIQLGTNDAGHATSDEEVVTICQTAFANYDTLIASIQDAGVSYVGLMLCPPPAATQDPFKGGHNRDRVKRNFEIWNQLMLQKWENAEIDGIYIVPSNTALDTFHNFPFSAAAPANSRTSMTVTRQSDSLHFTSGGAGQIADCVWAFLKFNSYMIGDYYLVINDSSSGVGSLNYALSTAPDEIIHFQPTLDGQTLDLANVVTSAGKKHVVGNGYTETILSGGISCTSETSFSNVELTSAIVLGGTMTLTDAFVDSLTADGGAIYIHKAVGSGGVIDLGHIRLQEMVADHIRISGLTLTNGYTTSNGGALDVSNQSATLVSCLISGNTANTGGGIRTTYAAHLTMTDCTVTGNTAGNGAGLFCDQGVFSRCTISGNVGPADIRFTHSNAVVSAVDCTIGSANTSRGKLYLTGSNHFDEMAGASATILIAEGAIVDIQGATAYNTINPGAGGSIVVSGTGCTVINSAGTSVSITGGTYAIIKKDGTTT